MTDMPRVFRDAQVKARKEHKCCECKRTITVGEMYNKFTGCYDGEWSTFNTCAECDDLRKDILREADLFSDEGMSFGDLRTWAQESNIEFPVKVNKND